MGIYVKYHTVAQYISLGGVGVRQDKDIKHPGASLDSEIKERRPRTL